MQFLALYATEGRGCGSSLGIESHLDICSCAESFLSNQRG